MLVRWLGVQSCPRVCFLNCEIVKNKCVGKTIHLLTELETFGSNLKKNLGVCQPRYFVNCDLAPKCVHVLFLTIYFQISLQNNKDNGACVWYGICDSDRYYCSYNGTAKILNDSKAVNELTEYCPHLVNNAGDTLTCCDGKQVSWNMILNLDKTSIVITDIWPRWDLILNERKYIAEYWIHFAVN